MAINTESPSAALDRPAPDSVSVAPLESDVVRSVRNAVKLGLSLLGTWAVALGVRIFVPRYLGPATFGTFQFADAFTTTIFVLTGLGVDTYVRKEVATRPQHASDFFGGTLLLRVLLSAVVMLVAVISLIAVGKSSEVIRLVIVLGAAQLLTNVNFTYAALLHAVGEVDGLAVISVVTKLAWGAGIVVSLLFGGGVMSVAVTMLASEALRSLGLAVLARRHLALRMVVNVGASVAVIVASLPYYVAALAQTVYARIDVSIMSFLTSDIEVGWYGAAGTLAFVSLVLSPLIGWVLLPLTSRAAARSEEELMFVGRRAMEAILGAAFPITLLLALGADLIVPMVFGAPYAPATGSLRILAPTFVLTYAAMVAASMLIRLERGWAVTWVSIVGMFVSATLNLWLVPRCWAAFGRGGAGIGAATTLIITELLTTATMLWLLGRRMVDRRLTTVVLKTLAVCLTVAGLDRLLAAFGLWRLVGDAFLYGVLVVATGAVDVPGTVSFIREALVRRRVAEGRVP
ncbi:MAG TPA: flippase [Gemmatimonadaceae bacterium]|nr:flippase [Gemmatimonadaceae bacterium]